MSYQAYNVARLHGRDLVFRTRFLLRSLSASRPDLILCNSYPKSGTHLLYQILYSIPGWQKWDDIVSVQALCGIMNTANHLRWKIGSAPDRSIVRSHLMYCDEVLSLLADTNAKRLFIYRDLRDVAVSHARWVVKEKRIFLHDVYRNHFSNDHDRLMASIVGLPLGTPFGSNISTPDIGRDFSRWKGWITDPDTVAIRFEDLVGERGGGSEAKRFDCIKRIYRHLGIEEPIEAVPDRFRSSRLDPEESHTYRKGGKGQIGGWRDVFTEDHKDAFKRVAGELLIELGYENDLDW